MQCERMWIAVTAGATGLSMAPALCREIRKRGELVDVIYIDHDHAALAIARQLGFTVVELDWSGGYVRKMIKAALKDLSWGDVTIADPRNNPRLLRPVVRANAAKIKAMLDDTVRDAGEKGRGEVMVLIIEGDCGPTSATCGLAIASELEIWRKEWQATYPLLRVQTYALEAIPLDFKQGNGTDSNGLTAYFSRLNRAAMMNKGSPFDKLLIANGADYYPAQVDDLTLPKLSRRNAAGVGHMLGLKVLETNMHGSSATAFDYLEVMQSLPPQANITFFEVGYPQVADMRALKRAAGLARDSKIWNDEQRSALGEVCDEANLDTTSLRYWEGKYPMAVAPWWLIAGAATIAIGGGVSAYLLTPWPWQNLLAGASVLSAAIFAGVVVFTRWRQKDRAKRGVLNLLGAAFERLLKECRTPRAIPPTFRTGFTGEAKDLLEKPLVKLLSPEDTQFCLALVKNFIAGLVPEGIDVVHLISVADSMLLKTFGFTNADVAKMTGAKSASGYSSEATGLDFAVRYILVYGSVPDDAMKGWAQYEAMYRNANGASARFDAWPENPKPIVGGTRQ